MYTPFMALMAVKPETERSLHQPWGATAWRVADSLPCARGSFEALAGMPGTERPLEVKATGQLASAVAPHDETLAAPASRWAGVHTGPGAKS